TKYAAASPRFKPFRSASNGAQISSDKIIKVLNPLMVNFDRASVPPTITRSNFPAVINLAPSIMAFAAEEQAVLMVVTRPEIPKASAIFWVLSPAWWLAMYFWLSGLRSEER